MSTNLRAKRRADEHRTRRVVTLTIFTAPP
jgi:hypothetical protein